MISWYIVRARFTRAQGFRTIYFWTCDLMWNRIVNVLKISSINKSPKAITYCLHSLKSVTFFRFLLASTLKVALTYRCWKHLLMHSCISARFKILIESVHYPNIWFAEKVEDGIKAWWAFFKTTAGTEGCSSWFLWIKAFRIKHFGCKWHVLPTFFSKWINHCLCSLLFSPYLIISINDDKVHDIYSLLTFTNHKDRLSPGSSVLNLVLQIFKCGTHQSVVESTQLNTGHLF